MRLLIWGIVGLSGLGFAVLLLGVHGATDEPAAIRRAIRAPFQDLRRHDARALCEDFTPAVAEHLSAAGGSCEEGVRRLFSSSVRPGEYVPAADRAPRRPLEVSAIDWHGGGAQASSRDPYGANRVLRWRLSLVHGRWRIATPMTLRLRSDCARHRFGTSTCLDTLTLSLAERGQA